MVVIFLCQLKALHWNILLPHNKEHHHHPHTVAKSMLCFPVFFLITTNKMQLQKLHTANEPLSCQKKENFCFMVWVPNGKLHVSVQSTIYVIENYTYCQYYHMLIIKLLVVVSVHQDMVQKFYMGWMLQKKVHLSFDWNSTTALQSTVDTKMAMCTTARNAFASLAQEFQYHYSN